MYCIEILYQIEGLIACSWLIPQLCFTIKDCKKDNLSNNTWFDLSDQLSCALFKRAKCS